MSIEMAAERASRSIRRADRKRASARRRGQTKSDAKVGHDKDWSSKALPLRKMDRPGVPGIRYDLAALCESHAGAPGSMPWEVVPSYLKFHCFRCGDQFIKWKTEAVWAFRRYTGSGRFYCSRDCASGTRVFVGLDVKGGFRSSWELSFAKALNSVGVRWEYEPRCFNTPHGKYTPDFYLPEYDIWVEIKGHWFGKSREKFEWLESKHRAILIKSRGRRTPDFEWYAKFIAGGPQSFQIPSRR